jgi:lysophospholipase L1-like esterase
MSRTWHLLRDNIAPGTLKIGYGNYVGDNSTTSASLTLKVALEYPSLSILGTVTNGSPIITTTSTAGMTTGMQVFGVTAAYFPAGTTVTVTGATTLTASQNATSSGTNIYLQVATITPCTFSSSGTATVAANTDAISDPCNTLAMTDGSTLWVRTLQQQITGTTIILGGEVGTAGPPLQNQGLYGNGGSVADLTAGGTFVSAAAAVLAPQYILAPTQKVSVCLAGDSRTLGLYDSNSDTSGDIGETARFVGPDFAYVNLGINGDAVQSAIGSYAQNYYRILAYCSHVIDQYGINDLALGSTAATLALHRSQFAAMTGKPVWGTTLPAETSSTDNFATIANQTTVTNTDAFNALVRSGIPGENGFFDLQKAIDPLNLQKWPVGPAAGQTMGTAFYSTADGAHETPTGNLIYKNSPLIQPSVLQR